VIAADPNNAGQRTAIGARVVCDISGCISGDTRPKLISGRVGVLLLAAVGRSAGLNGSGAMRRHLGKYLREFDQVFDAEDMQILSAAFDKAWEAVQASGVIYAEDKVDLVRAILAKHIIAAAKDGERDHSRLRDGALLALAKSNLRSTLR
jgi:hypothetical protein